MAEYHKYSIKKNRFRRGFLFGMEIKENELHFAEEPYRRFFIMEAIDGVDANARWGRCHLEWETAEDTMITVYAAASNSQSVWIGEEAVFYKELLHTDATSPDEKRVVFQMMSANRTVNQQDILLYELEGRYLYLMIEVQGSNSGILKNIFVDNQGDMFMDTFPEVYRERNSFFHRYLSVFSSMYLDFQHKIDNVAEILDVDTAPVELLPVFARWMGLDITGDFLKEDKLRLLVKEAYALNRIKGTKAALQRLSEIILGERVIILEKNVMREDTQADTLHLYEELYGDGTYDVTMLIHTYVPEHQKSQMLFLLNQFKPVRCRLKIRFLEQKGMLDSHSYLDMNAVVMEAEQGILDERQALDGTILLTE